MTLHVIAGVLFILRRFPRLSATQRDREVLAWAGRLLAILGVRVTVHGRPPDVHHSGALLVANHVSWLDISLLHSLCPVRFVSKAEVRDWPVVGRLAVASGTLFLERSRKADAHRLNGEMADLLRAGDCLALFPEGTTSDGSGLLPFYPSLLQPAIQAGAPVWPVAIRYRHPDGRLNLDAAYFNHMSLGRSLLKILGQREIRAEVHFLDPIPTAGQRRRELAGQAAAAIRAVLADDGRDSRPGTGAHPPA